eukprot:TRINITY_DN5845_c0_g1_i2.p1 TRINITY_DN5845_c0_g1~~TRINITY_DN5845_c0_g1_i2.p1  ORF type:complete len:132 (-),score=28.36 TRINITY_DN5845_c0_g1_i2:209-604(-)
MILKKIRYWTGKRILEEKPANAGDYQYTVVEYLNDVEQDCDAEIYEEDEEEGGISEAELQAFEDMILSFVNGMLSTQQKLALERIHILLTMYLPDPPLELTMPYVARLLDRFVKEERLESEGTVFFRRQQR